MRFGRILALLALFGSGACGSPQEPTWPPVVGIVEWQGESEDVVEAPSEVEAGERFTIVVSTYGPTGVYPGRTRVEVAEGGVVVVTPFDVQKRGAGFLDLRRIPRIVRLRLQVPGEYVLRIQGRESETLSPVFIDVPIRVL